MSKRHIAKPYKSEISPRRKKHFLIGMAIFFLGFLVLWSIGDDINENGYLLRAFLAPFLVLVAIVYIPYALYRGKD